MLSDEDEGLGAAQEEHTLIAACLLRLVVGSRSIHWQ